MHILGIDPAIVPLYLLLGGVGSVIGIYAGGRATDWRPMPSLLAVLLLQALFAATMLWAVHDPVLMAVNIFLSGATGFAFSTPLQARVLHAARAAPNLAASLVSTAFNIGIAGGALLGAVLLTGGVSYAALPAVGIFCGLLAAGVSAFSWWLDGRTVAAE